jgi:hypothetical protein
VCWVFAHNLANVSTKTCFVCLCAYVCLVDPNDMQRFNCLSNIEIQCHVGVALFPYKMMGFGFSV